MEDCYLKAERRGTARTETEDTQKSEPRAEGTLQPTTSKHSALAALLPKTVFMHTRPASKVGSAEGLNQLKREGSDDE